MNSNQRSINLNFILWIVGNVKRIDYICIMDIEVVIAILVPIVIGGSALLVILRDKRKGRDPFDGSSNNDYMDDTGI